MKSSSGFKTPYQIHQAGAKKQRGSWVPFIEVTRILSDIIGQGKHSMAGDFLFDKQIRSFKSYCYCGFNCPTPMSFPS